MNSFNVGVLGFTAGKESGNVPGPEKLEPAKQIHVNLATGMTNPKLQLTAKVTLPARGTKAEDGLKKPLFQAD